jgi:hypothetical protein
MKGLQGRRRDCYGPGGTWYATQRTELTMPLPLPAPACLPARAHLLFLCSTAAAEYALSLPGAVGRHHAKQGAGSFWNYVPTLNLTSGGGTSNHSQPSFTADLYGLNTRFREERQVLNCHCDPVKCVAQGCTFESGCDGPYLH